MGLNLVDEAKAASCDHIPIIDLSNIDSPDVEKRQELARAVCDACTGVGFFYIKVLVSIFLITIAFIALN
jgi:hypothetical protein